MVESKARIKERWTLTFIRTWSIIGIVLLFLAAGWLLSAVSSALVPFALGLVVVLLLRRPVELLATRMNRLAAVLVCYVAAALVIGLALTFLIPPIYAQVAQFIQAVPGYVQQAFRTWDVYIAHPAKGSGVPAWLQTAVIALKDQIVSGAGSWSTAIAQFAVSAGGSIATGVVGLIIAFIIGFYALVDLPHLEREVFTIAGERSREELTHALKTITRVIGGWLRGTLIQSTIVAILFSVGLAIVGVPYALAIGVIGGLLNVIPYVGPLVTAVLAAAAGLFVSPAAALWAIAIVFAVQQLDSLVLAPRILAGQVDLHPLLVILALLAGATLFGIPGMVLSVPVAAVVKGLFVYWFEKRTERQISSEDGVLFHASEEESEQEAAALGLDAEAEGVPGPGDVWETVHGPEDSGRPKS